ncbi:class I SAM-dependent methyltransferase [Bacillus massiliglaciei]|uniref:class I SAM-dependent methyltransferase n=1 Tax=Bacillus massiliglaciei TaxID=1816693 RepID=UPI000B2CE95F|nr:class I SAM-dependent methyltransferase [Bacillus massiliglaciei]
MGREFIELFEEWSETYDAAVGGHDKEYAEVFRHYESILDSVASKAEGHVLEFGPGTGNLTAKLLERGLQVTGIEPSPSMRRIAARKLAGRTDFLDGDFLEFDAPDTVDTVVSTYAFHHLTDEEKEKAVEKYGKLLRTDGKIVFADTMYQSRHDRLRSIEEAKTAGFHNLAEDLGREFYTTIPFLQGVFEQNQFTVEFTRCNRFVWIVEAVKK